MTPPDDLPPQEPPSGTTAARRRGALPRLHTAGWFATAGLIGWQLYSSPQDNAFILLFGAVIILLAALPALNWARQATGQIPALAVLTLTAIPFYAFPLFRQHPATQLFPDEVLLTSAFAIIVFLAVANLAHRFTKGEPLKHKLWRESLLNPRQRQLPIYGIYLNVGFLYVTNYTDLIPWGVLGVLRALFFGAAIASTFLAAGMWGRRELSIPERSLLAIGFFAQFAISVSTLYLISATSLVLLAFIGYVSESRRIPLIPVLLVGLLVAVLHNGKGEMRRAYWFEGQPAPQLTDLPAYFTEWLHHGLTFSRESDRPIATGILERTSLFHIMCLVVDRTPSLRPHLDGTTYRSIPLLLVPRFIWPDKPAPHDSNRTLSIYYGLSTEESARNVSIAFGTPAEAYANFGLFGLTLLGALYGWFFKRVERWCADAPTVSFAGIAKVLLIAWSFQAEMTLAVWTSSLFQAAVALIAAPMALKAILNR